MNDASGGAPKRRVPADKDEYKLDIIIRRVLTTHAPKTFLLVVGVSVAELVWAVRFLRTGVILPSLLLVVSAIATIGLFVIDCARLDVVKRRTWSRWIVRSWWVLAFAPFVIVPALSR